jgi:cytochrome c556
MTRLSGIKAMSLKVSHRPFFVSLIVASMALAVPAYSAGHAGGHGEAHGKSHDDDHSSHDHETAPAFSADAPASGTIVEQRVNRFKSSGSDIQAIFKKHLGADDFVAIDAAASRIGDWADVMPRYFPIGSSSDGAKPEIWLDFDDFTAKAATHAQAARKLSVAAKSGDKAQIVAAAKAMGGTCKSCHQSYRNKK